MNQLTVVIPYFNDIESAREMLTHIGHLQHEVGVSFLLVDNGSKNEELGFAVSEMNLPNVSFVKTQANLGFGGGIKLGIKNVSTSHVGWMPGNLKVMPSDAIYLWKKWLDNPQFDAVKAKRKRHSRIEALKTFTAGSLASLVYGKNLFDSGGTPTLAKMTFMNGILKVAPSDYDFEIFTLLVIRTSKLRLMRPRVSYGKRKYGLSHWQTDLGAEFRLLIKLLSQQKRVTSLMRSQD